MIFPYISCRSTAPLLAVLLAVATPLAAQNAGSLVPDAGAILRQIQPVVPPAVSSSVPALTIERADGSTVPMSAPFIVQDFRISGNTLFETTTLHALVANAQGQTLTLPQLGELAARISNFYQSRGYPLARAIIPAQTIASGVVRIEVIEARYGSIALHNASRVSEGLLRGTLSPLQGGGLISQVELDRTLSLLSEIPGVMLGATLTPGQKAGTSDLLVNITPGAAVAGDLRLDGYGNRYTGRARLGGTVKLHNPLHQGDTLSLSGLSAGSGINYARLAYEALVSGQGTRLGGAYYALRYSLGDPLAALNAHGTVRGTSLWAKHLLGIRQGLKLYGQVQFEAIQLRDHLDTSAIRTDRRLQTWAASLAGEAHDPLLSGGITTWNLGWTSGRVAFDDGAAQLADAASARTRGSFSKWNASLARVQSVGAMDALYLSWSAQWAAANLDSSQKMGAGGPNLVRAYDAGALSGDQGQVVSAEYRHILLPAWAGQWTLVALLDSARVRINKSPWSNAANSATLSGAGVGLDWIGPSQWGGKAYVATPLGAIPSLAGSSSPLRAWLELSRRF